MTFYSKESGPLARRYIRYVLNNVTNIIVLSETWRRSIETITNNKRIEVIVNPARPHSGSAKTKAKDSRTLLFLGRIGRHKGIYVLLDAMARLMKNDVDVRLVCAGDGDVDKAKAVVTNLGLQDKVEIHDWIDEAKRNELLELASIYVLPSYGEGLPMSIVEAMSAGLPIVATPVGGIPQAVTDGMEGLLVPVGDSHALSDAIEKLLGDQDYRDAMGRRALAKFNAHFSANVVLQQLESLYRDLGVTPNMQA
jgi:glycosyltransferase involved in cell wall biosynthesis